MFNGQNFTGFSNGKYTVVLGTNKILSNTTNNEYKITHIFQNILKQNYDINVYGKSSIKNNQVGTSIPKK